MGAAMKIPKPGSLKFKKPWTRTPEPEPISMRHMARRQTLSLNPIPYSILHNDVDSANIAEHRAYLRAQVAAARSMCTTCGKSEFHTHLTPNFDETTGILHQYESDMQGNIIGKRQSSQRDLDWPFYGHTSAETDAARAKARQTLLRTAPNTNAASDSIRETLLKASSIISDGLEAKLRTLAGLAAPLAEDFTSGVLSPDQPQPN